ncbi:MAG: hypothetical protein DSY83_09065 [Flavobacteriia bacterium]|nr:MAG: hypothetical protein DSY83_09065 [Flavobacteriia bacterium]
MLLEYKGCIIETDAKFLTQNVEILDGQRCFLGLGKTPMWKDFFHSGPQQKKTKKYIDFHTDWSCTI